MSAKPLNLLIFLFFLNNNICFSQPVSSVANPDSVVNRYNLYLKSVGLGKIIKAVSFSPPDGTEPEAVYKRLPHKPEMLLRLIPTARFSDPDVFNVRWKRIVDAASAKTNLYSQLFLKLVDYSGRSPQSLAVIFESTNGDLSSFIVYFDKFPVTKTSFGKTRAGEEIPPAALDPGDLDNGLIGGLFRQVPYDDKLNERIISAVTHFLKGKEKNLEIPPPKRWDFISNFTLSDVKGRVQDKYYERIVVQTIVIPLPAGASKSSSSDQRADIQFEFSIYLAEAGPFGQPPKSYNLSENAINQYNDAVSKFGAALKSTISNVILWKKY